VSRVCELTALATDPHSTQEHPMSFITRSVKKHIKARQRRRRTAQERLAWDRRQAQHAAKVVEQVLQDLGLPDNLGYGEE
jgi:hypothetical protein